MLIFKKYLHSSLLITLFIFLMNTTSIYATSIEDDSTILNIQSKYEKLIDKERTLYKQAEEYYLKEKEEKNKLATDLNVEIVNLNSFIDNFYTSLLDENMKEENDYYIIDNQYKIKKSDLNYFKLNNRKGITFDGYQDELETIKIDDNHYLYVSRFTSNKYYNDNHLTINGYYHWVNIEQSGDLYVLTPIKDFKELYIYKDLFSNESFTYLIDIFNNLNVLNENEFTDLYKDDDNFIFGEKEIKSIYKKYEETNKEKIIPIRVISSGDDDYAIDVYNKEMKRIYVYIPQKNSENDYIKNSIEEIELSKYSHAVNDTLSTLFVYGILTVFFVILFIVVFGSIYLYELICSVFKRKKKK